MTDLRLIVGNKTYSTWSLRAWLALRLTGLAFDETLLPLDTAEFAERIGTLSPSRTVPALHTPDGVVWDSLAIIEWAAERVPGLWPLHPADRARARSLAAEMHSGFDALRAEMPMNLRRTPGAIDYSDACARDIDRIGEIWRACLDISGGPFLFGEEPGAVDAMYAPVASRLRTYQAENDETAPYCATVAQWPLMAEWTEAARTESWIVEADER